MIARWSHRTTNRVPGALIINLSDLESFLAPSTWIPGTPAPFATRREKAWRDQLAQAVPDQLDAGTGLKLSFVLSDESKWARKTDIDNLCDPVFSVVINGLGWIGGRRPNLEFFWAEKRYGRPTGLELTSLSGCPTRGDLPLHDVVFEGTFDGPLPNRATNTEIPDWLRSLKCSELTNGADRLGVHLRFSTRINIGDVATGPVKSVIDCLHPILGGTARAPEDWRVHVLVVEKGTPHIPGTVGIAVYRLQPDITSHERA